MKISSKYFLPNPEILKFIIMKKVYVATILGSPAAECANFGICKVEKLSPMAWKNFQPQHLRHAKAIISLSPKSDWICLEFSITAMRPDTFQFFFADGTFRIDTVGQLPDKIMQALATKGKSIVPGIYPVAIDEESIVLEVECLPESLLFEAKSPDNLSSHLNGDKPSGQIMKKWLSFTERINLM